MTQAHNPNAIGTVVPIWAGGGGGGGGGGPASVVRFEITQADLVAGVFAAVHNLGNAYVTYQLYDNSDQVTQPDDALGAGANQLDIDLSSFEPIPGTWNLVVVG